MQSPRDAPVRTRFKTLGIIGGIGPESTIDYYRQFIAALRGRDDAPSIVINSIDVNRMLALVAAGDLASLTQYLLGELHVLARAGATLGLLAANTPHIVFDELCEHSPIPLVGIVEATCDAVRAMRLQKVGLIGTRFTMQGGFYSSVFARANIALVTPGADDQDFIHERYMTELVQGRFVPATRDGLLAIVARMSANDSIEGLILAGTELPLILTEDSYDEVPVFNTTRIHVQATIARLVL